MAKPKEQEDDGNLQPTSASLFPSERSFLAKFGGGVFSTPKLMAIIMKGIGEEAFNALSGQPQHRRKDDA